MKQSAGPGVIPVADATTAHQERTMRQLGFFSGIILTLLVGAFAFWSWRGSANAPAVQTVLIDDAKPTAPPDGQPGGATPPEARRSRFNPLGGWGGPRLTRATPGIAQFDEAIGLLAELNLTPEFDLSKDQKEHVQAIRDGYKSATEKWRKEKEADFEKINEEFRKAREEGKREAFTEISAKNSALMQTAPKAEEYVSQLKQALTADQLKQFEDRIEARKAEREEMGRRFMEGGRGGPRPPAPQNPPPPPPPPEEKK